MTDAFLERNIIKYNFYKIFTKRVFLPLIAIYLTVVGQVTLGQLGIIASITALVSLIMEIPAGYIADKIGHKTILCIGSFITAVSPLFYVISPNFTGGVLASVLFFAGSAFTSGTIQAFVHETLVGLGRDSEYVKVMGKAQSYGLLGNIVLISLIPLSYRIYPTLPFILGSLCLFIAFFLVLSFKTPTPSIKVSRLDSSFISDIKKILSWKAVFKIMTMFLIFGIVSASFETSVVYRELIFKGFGIPTEYFGPILALGSLVAAIGGNYIYKLKKMRSETFYLFDICYIVASFVLIGISKSVAVTIIMFTLIVGYDRTRNIIYESIILDTFPRSGYKSTLLSIMSFFTSGNAIWVPIVLAYLVSFSGIMRGYALFGGVMFLILILIFLGYSLIKKDQKGN